MQVLFKAEKDTLTVFLSGDIDHHTAKGMREAIDEEIRRRMPRELVIDFREVHFMDSSGVGLVMGRYKTGLVYGCNVRVVNMPKNVEKIMLMSGLRGIINFEKEDCNEKVK